MSYLKHFSYIVFISNFIAFAAFGASAASDLELEARVGSLYRTLQGKIEAKGYDTDTNALVEIINSIANPRNVVRTGLSGEAEKEMAEYLLSLKKYEDAAVWYIDAYRNAPHSKHEMDSYLATISRERGIDLTDLISKGEDATVTATLKAYWMEVDAYVASLIAAEDSGKKTVETTGKRPRVETEAPATLGGAGSSSAGRGITIYDAKDVAHDLRIIAPAEDTGFSNLKLQKLMYFAQASHLAVYQQPLFGNDIVAWVHGPVVPEVYQDYKKYGDSTLPLGVGESAVIEDEHVQKFLSRVYEIYGKYSAWSLRQLSHEEESWKATAKDQVIKHELMKHFFAGRDIIEEFRDLDSSVRPKTKTRG